MQLKEGYTNRGFKLIEFKDRYDIDCSIQESSLATDEAIWFGVQDAQPKIMASRTVEGGTGWVDYPIPDDVLMRTRMHLTREQIKAMMPILQNFVDTGSL